MSRLCMFHPVDHPMERGWVGRIDGDRVVQLAAQTLQSFFTGGGSAREHAVYPIAEVRLLAPVLHPPSIRIFDEQSSFVFANPAAVVGPEAKVACGGELALVPRLAGVVGLDEAVAGFTLFAEWREPGLPAPKDRDFALGLGPVVVTTDELDPNGLEAVVRVDAVERSRGTLDGVDWPAARDLAAERTRLYPGDLLVGPGLAPVDGIRPGATVEFQVDRIGVLGATIERD